MTIAYIFDEFPSRSETFLAREVEALRAGGDRVEVWALRAGEGALDLEIGGGLAAKVGRRLQGEAWWADAGRRWAQRNERALAGIGHLHAAWASHPAALAMGMASQSGLPWSFSAHARDLWLECGDLQAKLASSTFASACTREGAWRLRELAPPGVAGSRVVYAPHGLPLGEWPLRPVRVRGGAEPWQVLAVGRLVPKKGFGVLLEALDLLRDEVARKGDSLQARIIGAGPLRGELTRRIEALNLGEIVSLEGALASSQVREAMERADAFVMPCRMAPDGDRDGLPNVLLEAAATGVPIVASREGSVGDLCDEQSAYLCEPGDAVALATALNWAWNEAGEDASRRRVLEARRRVQEQFDIARNIGVLRDAFHAARGK
jgi:glycosyltransferase involved in cell wall biosynthesis